MTFPSFNYDSLILMTIVNLLTTGGVMMFIWNVDRPGPGLVQMAWGDLLIGFGLLIAALRTVIPGGPILLVSNLAMFAGVMLIWTGVRAFRGIRRLPVTLILAISAVYSATFVYWIFFNNDAEARIFAGCVALGLITVLTAAAMLTDVPLEDRRLYYFSGTLLSFHAFALALRAGWAVTHAQGAGLFAGSPADFTVMFTMNFLVTGCCLAVATASSRKLYHTTRKLALHDPLTQLPNRRMFEDRLRELTNAGGESNVALIYLDLDNFKLVNDTFGHSAGDMVLRSLAERIKEQFTERGFPARLGGDEFVILIENVRSRQAAFKVMGSMIRAIHREIAIGDTAVCIDVSGGLAMYPEDAASLSELIDVADRSMYRAKCRQRAFKAFTDHTAATQLETSPKSIAQTSLTA
jgi:diguanylate cyclase (GGDEF)-like protein